MHHSLRIVFLLLIFFSCTVNEKTKEGIQYPGNLAGVGDTAKLFAEGIVSTDFFEHSAPTFSSDGKSVLWAIMEVPSWKASLLEMNYDHGKWTTPHRPSFCDTTASDINPSFSGDGQTIYFSSSRKLPKGQFPAKGNVIWRVKKTEAGWADPVPLDSTISRGGDYAPSVANNGNIYFTHGPFRSPDWDILVASTNSNGKSTPSTLSINTSGYEDGPFIAPDESYIIFESDRTGGVGESIDLYISFKSENGSWNEPVNLGPTINSRDTERFARVSPDGKFLFFGSNRRRVNGQPNFDIYWISAEIIEKLR